MNILHQSSLRRPCLVYVRCGNKSIIEDWFVPNKSRGWDVIISYYEVPENFGDLKQRGFYRDRTVVSGGLSKFSSFQELVEERVINIEKYRMVMFLDDDILIPFDDIDALFEICLQHDTLLAQPCLDRSSPSSWGIAWQRPNSLLRFTNFIEIMMPIMSSEAIQKCLTTFNQSVSGWGLDFIWPKLLGYPTDKIAIIDKIKCIHTKSVDTKQGPFYRYLASLGIDPYQEAESVCSGYGIKPSEAMHKIYNTIYL